MKTLIYNYSESLGYPVGSDMRTAIINAMLIAKVFNTIVEYQGKPVNVWARGSSGTILGAIFIANISNQKAKLCHVKKDYEYAHDHSSSYYDGTLFTDSENGFVNVIIDDFVSTGNTLEAIAKVMLAHSGQCVDVICLTSCNSQSATEWYLLIKMIPAYFIRREYTLKNNYQKVW